jgi:hypothetical protein
MLTWPAGRPDQRRRNIRERCVGDAVGRSGQRLGQRRQVPVGGGGEGEGERRLADDRQRRGKLAGAVRTVAVANGVAEQQVDGDDARAVAAERQHGFGQHGSRQRPRTERVERAVVDRQHDDFGARRHRSPGLEAPVEQLAFDRREDRRIARGEKQQRHGGHDRQADRDPSPSLQW